MYFNFVETIKDGFHKASPLYRSCNFVFDDKIEIV